VATAVKMSSSSGASLAAGGRRPRRLMVALVMVLSRPVNLRRAVDAAGQLGRRCLNSCQIAPLSPIPLLIVCSNLIDWRMWLC
jgi:hypothetical protein